MWLRLIVTVTCLFISTLSFAHDGIFRLTS